MPLVALIAVAGKAAEVTAEAGFIAPDEASQSVYALQLRWTVALSVGVVIDDAIVVLENIYRHLEEGEGPFAAALSGTREIALAALSTLGCDVEVASVSDGGIEAWTLAFAAFGPPPGRRENILDLLAVARGVSERFGEGNRKRGPEPPRSPASIFPPRPSPRSARMPASTS